MRALLLNLLAGFRLATFQRVAVDQLHVSIPQLVLLSGVEFGLGVGAAYLSLDGDGNFNTVYVLYALASLTLTLGMAALLAFWTHTPALLPGYAVAATAMSPMLIAYSYASRSAWQTLEPNQEVAWAWMLGWLLLIMLLLMRAVRVWAPLKRAKRVAISGFLVAVLAAELWLLPHVEAWYPASPETETLGIGRHEALLYQQAGLLDHTLNTLQPQRPNAPDLYFVGFAGSGWQDVFMKEVNTVRALFDNRFDTRGRSVVLINDTKQTSGVPIASTTALQVTLNRVGALLDPEEDVLFLFITSHGSSDPAYISVDNNGLDLTQLTPGRLKTALDATPIKWKVIVVSACYSGGFIPALRDDNSLVITASSADRNSFGCDDSNNMTDFGRAYFEEALNKTRSFTAAFEIAKKRIAEREKAEGLTPSQPQMAMGKQFAAHWRGRFD